MVFEWKEKISYKVSAQEVGEVCQELENTGGLTPERLVNVSKEETALLHNYFEWDNEIAGGNWRKQQARQIISHLVVKADDKPQVRAFVSVQPQEQDKAYYNIDFIVSRQDTRELLLNQAKRDLEIFKQKYNSLEEFTKLFDEIEKINN